MHVYTQKAKYNFSPQHAPSSFPKSAEPVPAGTSAQHKTVKRARASLVGAGQDEAWEASKKAIKNAQGQTKADEEQKAKKSKRKQWKAKETKRNRFKSKHIKGNLKKSNQIDRHL